MMRNRMILALVLALLPGVSPAQQASGEVSVLDPITCLLVPAHSSEIGSDRTGIVAHLAVRRADFVKAGQVLVQLDDSLMKSDLQIAQIHRDALAARLQRVDALVADNVISRDEVETMRTELAVAKAEAERARLQLDRTRITAPFDGYVAKLAVEEGELIGPQPLMTLIDMSKLKAELVFVSGAFSQLRAGQDLKLAVDLTGDSVPARIVSIDPYIDASSNTFSVIAEVDNSDLRLPAGASCRLLP